MNGWMRLRRLLFFNCFLLLLKCDLVKLFRPQLFGCIFDFRGLKNPRLLDLLYQLNKLHSTKFHTNKTEQYWPILSPMIKRLLQYSSCCFDCSFKPNEQTKWYNLLEVLNDRLWFSKILSGHVDGQFDELKLFLSLVLSFLPDNIVSSVDACNWLAYKETLISLH